MDFILHEDQVHRLIYNTLTGYSFCARSRTSFEFNKLSLCAITSSSVPAQHFLDVYHCVTGTEFKIIMASYDVYLGKVHSPLKLSF